MKRIVLVLALALLAGAAFGQEVGTWMVGGGASGDFGMSLFRESTQSDWTWASFDAFTGYFVAPGVAVGPWGGLSWQKRVYPSGDITRYRDFTVGAQGTFFFGGEERLVPFVALAGGYYNEQQKTNGLLDYKSTALRAQASFGVDYRLTDSVALSFAGALSLYRDLEYSENYYDGDVLVGLDLFLGGD